jgi:hypothetical protein
MAKTPESHPGHDDDKQRQTSSPLPALPERSDARPNEGPKKVALITAREVFIGFAGVVALATIGYAGIHWMEERIDKAVERKLSDETILRKIAAQSRPALLFDANESITADMGAGALIKTIQITEREKDGWPNRILIDFARHISSPPILTPLNESARILPRRAKGFAWLFDVQEVVVHNSDSNNWIFRLELAP